MQKLYQFNRNRKFCDALIHFLFLVMDFFVWFFFLNSSRYFSTSRLSQSNRKSFRLYCKSKKKRLIFLPQSAQWALPTIHIYICIEGVVNIVGQRSVFKLILINYTFISVLIQFQKKCGSKNSISSINFRIESISTSLLELEKK